EHQLAVLRPLSANLSSALPVDVEQAVDALFDGLIDGADGSAVPVTVYHRVLGEVARLHHAVELLVADEVVVGAGDLTRSGLAGGVRDREAEMVGGGQPTRQRGLTRA